LKVSLLTSAATNYFPPFGRAGHSRLRGKPAAAEAPLANSPAAQFAVGHHPGQRQATIIKSSADECRVNRFRRLLTFHFHFLNPARSKCESKEKAV
jgi:hypothetical protein